MEKKIIVRTSTGKQFPMTFNRCVQTASFDEQILKSLDKHFPIYLDNIRPNEQLLIRDFESEIEYLVVNEIMMDKGWKYIGTEFSITRVGLLNSIDFKEKAIEIKQDKLIIKFPQ